MVPLVDLRLAAARERPAWPKVARALSSFVQLPYADLRRAFLAPPVDLVVSLSHEQVEQLRALCAEAGVELVARAAETRTPSCNTHPGAHIDRYCSRCERGLCGLCEVKGAVCDRCLRREAGWRRFRHARIALLTLVLLAVAAGTFMGNRYLTSWERPVSAAVYLLVDDDVDAYWDAAERLGGDEDAHPQRRDGALRAVEGWLKDEFARWEVGDFPPVRLSIYGPLQLDTDLPEPGEGGLLDAMTYSLNLRFTLWRLMRRHDLPDAHMRLFVVVGPAAFGARREGVGFKEGHFGLVTVGEDVSGGHAAVVVAHELLHTVGATDKYGPGGVSDVPDGLADPYAEPRYPQSHAEIMSGYVPLDARRSRAATSLDACQVGPKTALEIGWLEPDEVPGPDELPR